MAQRIKVEIRVDLSPAMQAFEEMQAFMFLAAARMAGFDPTVWAVCGNARSWAEWQEVG